MSDEETPDHPEASKESLQSIKSLSNGVPKKRLEHPLDYEERRTALDLRNLYAKGIFRILTAQIVSANAGFFIYGFWLSWQIEPSVIQAWLAATVVQVIGIVLVVTRYLFPPHK